MVRRMSPDNADSAVTMEERVKIEDIVASAVLNAASGSGDAHAESSGIDNAQELDIFAASAQGKTELIRDLVESARARATDRDGDRVTPLHLAAINDRLEACTYLIEQGADVNAIGGNSVATPLQWAARNGLVKVIDLLIQHGANPRLFDTEGYDCLHSVTHSSNYWALLYLLCQPDIAVDGRDHGDHTALHWAVYQCDEVSTQILLKMGANPNAVGRDGLSVLHWAAFTGNRKCLRHLLEAGADIRAKNKDNRIAEEMATKYRNKGVWDSVVEELGLMRDGTRVRRPLSEPGVNVIAFTVPNISLCIAFTITGVFPWYMSIFLSPLVVVAMHDVVIHELLRRNSVNENVWNSPYFLGVIVATALWMAYTWVTRLRYDALNNPAIHTAFLFLFVLFMYSLLRTVFCDPGICDVLTKDALKPIIEKLVRGNRFNGEEFCIQCMAIKSPRTKHCSYCNKCITYSETMDIHASWMLNCISMKNHVYFMIFILSLVVGVLVFDYLVWTHLLALMDTALSSPSCVLPDAVCKVMSADMFLISVALWSTLQLLWGAMTIINVVVIAWKALTRSLKKLIDTDTVS